MWFELLDLPDVDHGGKEPREGDHQPDICGRIHEIWKPIRPGNSVEEEDAAKGRLIIEQLEAIDFIFALVCADPDSVNARNGNRAEGDKDAEHARALNGRSWGWWRFDVVVGDEGHTEAHGNQRIGGQSGNGFFVYEEVDDSNGGRKEDSGDLVKGNC